jgi:hypothetical protein
VAVNTNKAILFVDLDEVLVTRLSVSPDEETIVMIQPAAESKLKDRFGQLMILTHRSRKEALQIVNKINGLQCFAKDLVAAEDIIRAAILTGQIFSLLRNGIEKKLYLPIAERKYGINRRRFAILDDNPSNVDGILNSGGGLGLLAPKPEINGGEVTTFDFDKVLSKYKLFCNGEIFGQQCIKLVADKRYPLSTLKQFNLVKARRINYIRKSANIIRSTLSRL